VFIACYDRMSVRSQAYGWVDSRLMHRNGHTASHLLERRTVYRHHAAQQESCVTSLLKVWAQSLRLSTIVRYGNNSSPMACTVMRALSAITAVWISSPASPATACTPSNRPESRSATILMKPL